MISKWKRSPTILLARLSLWWAYCGAMSVYLLTRDRWSELDGFLLGVLWFFAVLQVAEFRNQMLGRKGALLEGRVWNRVTLGFSLFAIVYLSTYKLRQG